jgi:FkbM family methyltransferase
VDIFLSLGAKVVAVDPDTTNQHTLHQRFHNYRIFPRPVTIVRKAVSDKAGQALLWVDAPGSAKNTLNAKWVETLRSDDRRFGTRLTFTEQRQVQTTTLEDLFSEYGVPYFVKIDVEGHEAGVLRGLQQRVPFLSFEVNLPEFLEEGLECIQRLYEIFPSGSFNYAFDAGMKLPQWVGACEMLQLLSDCTERSIEVFWKTR